MKIMAVCGAGLGSSFMMEMNIKKVLKKINITAEVDHSDLGSVTPDLADVFVMGKRHCIQRKSSGKQGHCHQ